VAVVAVAAVAAVLAAAAAAAGQYGGTKKRNTWTELCFSKVKVDTRTRDVADLEKSRVLGPSEESS
jgi:hypothetical protein